MYNKTKCKLSWPTKTATRNPPKLLAELVNFRPLPAKLEPKTHANGPGTKIHLGFLSVERRCRKYTWVFNTWLYFGWVQSSRTF